MSKNNKNVGSLLAKQAQKYPDKVAIVHAKKSFFGGTKYAKRNFAQHDSRINKFANRLKSLGVVPGDRVLFFMRPNLDFSAITFALFRLGAVPVFVDPGMKRDYLFKTIQEVSPRVLIAVPMVHLLRRFHPGIFASVKIFITTGMLSGPTCKSIYRGLKKEAAEFSIYTPQAGDLAAILYTSGGTGPPKGVEYTHEIFINQTNALKHEFNLTQADVDVAGFPLFSFFTLAMGMTSVIPNMDFARPSECDPAELYRNIKATNATFLAGSPAIWERVANYCLEKKIKFDTVKYVVMFGAPVSLSLHQKFAKILLQGSTYTPYGATECLPVSNISGEYILTRFVKEVNSGRGTCIGKPINGNTVKIIKMSNEPIEKINDIEELGTGEVGEIIVKGSNVTRSYFNHDQATSLAKISDGKSLWHRMGDVGYLDQEGHIWFCGRKNHVVITPRSSFFPVQVESIFNAHPKIKRCALIKDNKENKAVVVIERYDQSIEIEPMFLMDLKNLAQTNEHTKEITDFYAVQHFPVDIRHNIKIDRQKLQLEVLG